MTTHSPAQAPAQLYKICTIEAWQEALSAATLPPLPADVADGYIHLCTLAQLPSTLALHYKGHNGLFILEVDAAALPSTALKWESARQGELFPHLYGALPMAAVGRVLPAYPNPDGSHRVPELDLTSE